MAMKGSGKLCSKCKIWKTLDNFYSDSSRSDGFHYQCKDCERVYRTKHDHIYYLKNKQRLIIRHREKEKQFRMMILEKLGKRCNNPDCPIPIQKLDERGLQIDHIHGGRYRSLKSGRKTSWNYFQEIWKELEKGSREYQVLCAWCNWMKRYHNKEFKERS